MKVCEIDTKRIDYLVNKYPGLTVTTSLEAALDSDLIVVAVKPQTLPHIADEINEFKVSPNSVFLSILAGTPMQDIKETFRTNKVIRTMPNTPAVVMQGKLG